MANPINFARNPLSQISPTSFRRQNLGPENTNSNPNPGLTVNSLQRELDTLTDQIAGVSQNRVSANSGYEIEDISTALSRFRVGNATLSPGQSVDLNVEVTEAYEQAGLYLSFSDITLDFTIGSTFTLLIEGAVGQKELSFTSGISLSNMKDAINTFSDETGVTANQSGTGITLFSTERGSTEFVSVSTGGDAVVVGEGIFQLRDTDPPVANGFSAATFQGAIAFPVTDFGQDLAVLVNGQSAQTNGTLVSYTGQFFDAQFDIKLGPLAKGETANSSNPGSFLAARILFAAPQGPLSQTPPGIDING